MLAQICGKGASELDQQWIIGGAKHSSRHYNKKNGLPISFFLEQTKRTIRFQKKLPISFLEMKHLWPPYLTTAYNIKA